MSHSKQARTPAFSHDTVVPGEQEATAYRTLIFPLGGTMQDHTVYSTADGSFTPPWSQSLPYTWVSNP